MATEVSDQLQDYYNQQYNHYDARWRRAGGRGKARNIVQLAEGLDIRSVLDVGSGEGAVLQWLDDWNWGPEITALDISESGVQQIEKRQLRTLRSVQRFDGYNIPFPDQAFDLVTCSHVLEHVEHYRLLLREIKRVSKYQIFEIPIDFSLRVDKKVAHFLAYGHINIFTPQTFRFLLQAEGFSILKSKGSLYDPEVYELLAHGSFLKKWGLRVKNFLWKNSPLMWLKPHVLTVLTSSGAF